MTGATHKFHCPDCKAPWVCPCNSCRPRHLKANPDYKPTWGWASDDREKCLTCGKTKHMDWWFDEEVRQLLEATGTSSLTEANKVMRERHD